jgi:4a-hydroxytetrahydrobiopterin dehydratase
MNSINLSSLWKETPEGLKATFKFSNFPEAIAFVNRLALLAEEANHHPDIDIRWNKVHLTLITHDAGHVITEKDYTLANRISSLV